MIRRNRAYAKCKYDLTILGMDKLAVNAASYSIQPGFYGLYSIVAIFSIAPSI
jgi:hypothetical protein